VRSSPCSLASLLPGVSVVARRASAGLHLLNPCKTTRAAAGAILAKSGMNIACAAKLTNACLAVIELPRRKASARPGAAQRRCVSTGWSVTHGEPAKSSWPYPVALKQVLPVVHRLAMEIEHSAQNH